MTGKVALVTGAGSGMGAACCRRFASDGYRVAAVDVDADALGRLTAGLGGDHLAITADVASPGQVTAAVAQTVARFGRLDVAVNAAGVLRGTRLADITPDEWEHVVAVNMSGAFWVTQAAARVMRDQGSGRIVHFSSTAGKTVSTLGGAHYTAAKHAVLGIVRAAAKELAPDGITVNAVCPGMIDTEMVRRTVSDEQADAFARSFPAGRLGTAEEVASLVAFLAGPDAAYLTGAAVDVNGGDLMV